MFQYLLDFMNMPGETGEIAREAILFALRLLEDDPEYVCYIVEYSNLCEVMVSKALSVALKSTDNPMHRLKDWLFSLLTCQRTQAHSLYPATTAFNLSDPHDDIFDSLYQP